MRRDSVQWLSMLALVGLTCAAPLQAAGPPILAEDDICCGPEGLIPLSKALLILAADDPAPAKTADPKADPKAQDAKAAKPEQKKADAPKFLRLVRNDKKEATAMQTAVVRYVPADNKHAGLSVDLVGAVHIGERSYYDQLNKLFEDYDVVLYELVAPEGTKIEKGETRSGNPISFLQNGMKDLLELEHQLSCVDYTKKNFVHADMSPDDFDKSMKDRGESIWTMVFKMMGAGLAQQSKNPSSVSEFDLLLALFDPDRAFLMKRILAEQFEDMEVLEAALEGPNGSTIVTERNKVALGVLSKQIEGGKKKIAIFYGAAHLADMESRLAKDFSLKRSEEKWLTAWNIAPKQAAAEKKPDTKPEPSAKSAKP